MPETFSIDEAYASPETFSLDEAYGETPLSQAEVLRRAPNLIQAGNLAQAPESLPEPASAPSLTPVTSPETFGAPKELAETPPKQFPDVVASPEFQQAAREEEARLSVPLVNVDPRLLTLGARSTPLGPLVQTPVGQAAAERTAEAASSMTSPLGLAQLPYYSVPYLGEALLAEQGAETIGGGLGEIFSGTGPESVGRGVADVVLGAPMLHGGLRNVPRLRPSVEVPVEFRPRANVPERLSEAPPEQILAVAVRKPNGEIVEGELGTKHNDIAKEAGIAEPAEKDRGYRVLNKDGSEEYQFGNAARRELLPVAEKAGQIKPDEELTPQERDLKKEGEVHGVMTKEPELTEKLQTEFENDKQKFADLGKEFVRLTVEDKIDTPEFKKIWQDRENIKNKYDGKDPFKVTPQEAEEYLKPKPPPEHRKPPPNELKDLLDEEGALFVGETELPDGRLAYTVEIYDPVKDPQAKSPASFGLLDSMTRYEMEKKISSKRAEFGWKKPAEKTVEEKPPGEAAPEPAATETRAPATVEDIIGRPAVDPVEAVLNRWIDQLATPPGLMADPLFVQSIGRPVARLALIAARETYRVGKNVAKAIEAGIAALREHLEGFDEDEARAWLKESVPTVSEAKKSETTERQSLREVLSKSEAAGEAGRKAGIAATKPAVAKLQAQLSDSISKARALAEHLRGQEIGAARGAEFTKEQAELIDRWLAADSESIRESLTQLVNQLPVSERGRFLSAITQAIRRPKLYATTAKIAGEKMTAVEGMYFKASQVASRIENRIAEVEINDLSDQVRGFDKWKNSTKIDVPYRKIIRTELSNFERLRKNGDLTKDSAQAALDRLTSLRDIGRSEQTVKQAIWEWQKEFAKRRLSEQQTTPVETRPQFRPSPGDPTPLSMRIRNYVNRARNNASWFDKAILPIDALFDLMDEGRGTYRGWLFRHARGPVDLAYNEARVLRNERLKPIEDFIKQKNMTVENSERIGVFAQAAQKGGRERLIEMGLSPERIDQIVSSMTRDEMELYGIMRAEMDSRLLAIQELMRKLYNTEVNPVENYFPMPRDWRVFDEQPPKAKAPGSKTGFDELATWKALRDDLFPQQTHTARKGFTISRKPGAETPVRIDAFDIFRQHVNDVAYLENMQPVLKQLGELGRDDLFLEKYGDVGRKIFLDWLDTVARQGGVESFKRWQMLDTLRKNTSVGVIGFRLASQLVHESNVPYIYARIGNWFNTGMYHAITDRGQAFIKRNFAETVERGGGEPAQAESEALRKGSFGGLISPRMTRAAFAIARQLDRYNSQAGVLGAYLRELKLKGADWQNYDSIPIDREAQARALVLTRRAIASPLPKDVPQAISRGALTAKNVSVGRTLFQFQNIFLDQWSNIRIDLYQAGIRSNNPKQAAIMTLAVIGSIAIETAIKQGTKQAIESIFPPSKPKKEDEHAFAKKAVTETVRRFPLGGQIEAEVIYGETGIPSLDSVVNVAKSSKYIFTGKKPETRRRAAFRTAAGIAQLAGFPGASQIEQVVESATK